MELLDVYNNDGKRTGKVIERENNNISLNEDEHMAVAIVYIENDNNEFLIQKTSKLKDRDYCVTAGHVQHNEEPIDTIIREVKEELGIDISNENIIDLGYMLVDNPIRFIFYLKKNININNLVLQEDEVDSVSYMNEVEIRNLISEGHMHKAHSYILDRILEYRNTHL